MPENPLEPGEVVQFMRLTTIETIRLQLEKDRRTNPARYEEVAAFFRTCATHKS